MNQSSPVFLSFLQVMAGYDGGMDPRQPRDLKVPEYTSLVGLLQNCTSHKSCTKKKKAEGQRCVLCFFSNQSPEIIRVSLVNQSLVRPRLSERWIALATRQISIRWTVQNVLASDLFVGQRYLPFEQLAPVVEGSFVMENGKKRLVRVCKGGGDCGIETSYKQ